ncbi:thioredoxin TrxC [Marinobacteraceae bacterium S3BR75-40.1]
MTETIQIVCPHCHKTNRLPADRLGDKPKCGDCKRRLADGAVAEISDDILSTVIEKSSLPVLVDFWADWCGPCKVMAPEFKRAAAHWAGKVAFAKVHTQESPHAAHRFHIRSIPTLVLFQGGREVARLSGAMPESQLNDWLRQHLVGVPTT